MFFKSLKMPRPLTKCVSARAERAQAANDIASARAATACGDDDEDDLDSVQVGADEDADYETFLEEPCLPLD